MMDVARYGCPWMGSAEMWPNPYTRMRGTKTHGGQIGEHAIMQADAASAGDRVRHRGVIYFHSSSSGSAALEMPGGRWRHAGRRHHRGF